MPFVILYVSQPLGDLLPLDFLPKKEMGTYELKSRPRPSFLLASVLSRVPIYLLLSSFLEAGSLRGHSTRPFHEVIPSIPPLRYITFTKLL
jgi:hypothetical protein